MVFKIKFKLLSSEYVRSFPSLGLPLPLSLLDCFSLWTLHLSPRVIPNSPSSKLDALPVCVQGAFFSSRALAHLLTIVCLLVSYPLACQLLNSQTVSFFSLCSNTVFGGTFPLYLIIFVSHNFNKWFKFFK